MGDLGGCRQKLGVERLGEPWNTRVQVLLDRKEETQSTI